MDQNQTFLFIPQNIVDDLGTIGNWQIRAAAIDNLHKIIRNEKDNKKEIIEALPEFLDFLMILVNDPNFKISLSTMEIIGDLIINMQNNIKPYINTIIIKLYEKLGDNKILVKQACIDVFKNLMRVVSSPLYILTMLEKYVTHENYRVREEIIAMHILILLDQNIIINENLLKDMFLFFVKCLSDGKDKVRHVAMEAIAVIHSKMNFETIINDNICETVKKAIYDRLQNNKELPSLSKDGYVDFKMNENDDVIRNVKTARSTLSSSGKIPWNIPSPCGRRRSGPGTPPPPPPPLPVVVPPFLNTTLSMVQENHYDHNNDDITLKEENTPRNNEKDEMVKRITKLLSDNETIKKDILSPENFHKSKGRMVSTMMRNKEDIGAKVHSALDRIDRFIKENNENAMSDNPVKTNCINTSMTTKNKKTLEILKKRQQEARRTYSANAVLQRSSPSEVEKNYENDEEREDEFERSLMMKTDFGRRKTTVKVNNITKNEDKVSFVRNRRHNSLSPKRMNNNETKLILDNNVNEICKDKKIEELSIENLMPCMNPEETLQESIENLKSAGRAKRKELDWQEQYEALNQMRRLVKHHSHSHSHLLKKSLREVIYGILPAVESLRSSTSKNAIILLQEMFMKLGKELDKDLEEIIPVLLKKAAENSITGRDTFLATNADKALTMMIENVTQSKVLQVLLLQTDHKSMNVRAKVAAHMSNAIEIMAVHQNALNYYNLIEKVFKIAIEYLEEGSQLTRTFSKRIIWNLKQWIQVNHKDLFDKLLFQIDSGIKRKKVLEIFESNSIPVPPSLPSSFISSKQQQQQQQQKNQNTGGGGGGGGGSGLSPHTPTLSHPSRVSSINTSFNKIINEETSENGGQQQQQQMENNKLFTLAVKKRSINTQLSNAYCNNKSQSMQTNNNNNLKIMNIEQMNQMLNSRDWKERIEALNKIKKESSCIKYLNETQVLELMDQMTAKLNDGNSKVLLIALECFKCLFEENGHHLLFSLNSVISTLSSNLGSTNEKIRNAANEVIEIITAKFDSIDLIQSFSLCIGYGNVKGKLIILKKLPNIINDVMKIKPNLIIKHTIPMVFLLLNEKRLEMRNAVSDVLKILKRWMGSDLLQYGENLSRSQKERLFEILNS